MKKLINIVATAFLALSIGFSPMACSKKHEFDIKEAEELIAGTEIVLKGNVRPFTDTAKKEKEYLEKGLERKFYGFTSNEEVYIELMIFKHREKKLFGEEGTYAYIAFWGDPADAEFKGFRKDKKYKIEDEWLDTSSNLENFKKELENIYDSPKGDYFFCGKGRGRSFTLYEDDFLNKTTLYFGLRLRNLETGKSEDLVYAIKIEGAKKVIDADKEWSPTFQGYSNGIISYQDTDNDPIPSVIVKSEDENGGMEK